jgi:hypothetical protein
MGGPPLFHGGTKQAGADRAPRTPRGGVTSVLGLWRISGVSGECARAVWHVGRRGCLVQQAGAYARAHGHHRGGGARARWGLRLQR